MTPSLNVRLGVLAAVFVLLAGASVRWALQDHRGDDGAVYIAIGVAVIALAAGAHLLAARYPHRPALEGLAWVLTIVAVVGVGMGSLAMAVSPQDSTPPFDGTPVR